jgi:hypothetical protein
MLYGSTAAAAAATAATAAVAAGKVCVLCQQQRQSSLVLLQQMGEGLQGAMVQTVGCFGIQVRALGRPCWVSQTAVCHGQCWSNISPVKLLCQSCSEQSLQCWIAHR